MAKTPKMGAAVLPAPADRLDAERRTSKRVGLVLGAIVLGALLLVALSGLQQ